jgi:uncharacterized protein (TIGR00730 family)
LTIAPLDQRDPVGLVIARRSDSRRPRSSWNDGTGGSAGGPISGRCLQRQRVPAARKEAQPVLDVVVLAQVLPEPEHDPEVVRAELDRRLADLVRRRSAAAAAASRSPRPAPRAARAAAAGPGVSPARPPPPITTSNRRSPGSPCMRGARLPEPPPRSTPCYLPGACQTLSLAPSAASACSVARPAGTTPSTPSAARALGTTLATRGLDLVYGGGRVGLMGEVADAALAAGGRVFGVIPQKLCDLESGHPGLTELFVVDSMHARKMLMAQLSDAFIALPGGFGTLEELFEVVTWSQLGYHRKPGRPARRRRLLRPAARLPRPRHRARVHPRHLPPDPPARRRLRRAARQAGDRPPPEVHRPRRPRPDVHRSIKRGHRSAAAPRCHVHHRTAATGCRSGS